MNHQAMNKVMPTSITGTLVIIDSQVHHVIELGPSDLSCMNQDGHRKGQHRSCCHVTHDVIL
jgi:hypothetical protein